MKDQYIPLGFLIVILILGGLSLATSAVYADAFADQMKCTPAERLLMVCL